MNIACPNCGHGQVIDVDAGAGAVRARCDKCGTSYLVRVKSRAQGKDGEQLFSWFVRKEDGTLFSFPGDKQLHQGIKRGFVVLDDAISADGKSWTTIASLPILAAFMERWNKDGEAEDKPAPKPAPPAAAKPVVPKTTVQGTQLFETPDGVVAQEELLRETMSQHATMIMPEQKPPQGPRSAPIPPFEPVDPEKEVDGGAATRPDTPRRVATASTDSNIRTDVSPVAETPAPAAPQSHVATPASGSAGTVRPDEELEWGDEWKPKNLAQAEQTALEYYHKKRSMNITIGVLLVLLAVAGLVGVHQFTDLMKDEEKTVKEVTGQPTRAVPPAAVADVRTTADVQAAATDADSADAPADVQAAADVVSEAGSDVPGATTDVALASDVATRPGVEGAQADIQPAARDIAGQSDTASAGKEPPSTGAGEAVQPGPGPEALKPEPLVPAVDVEARERERERKRKEEAERKEAARKDREKRERDKERHTGRDKEKDSARDGAKRDSEVHGFDALMAKANRLRKGGNHSAALGFYQKALNLKPGYSEAHYKLADCLRHTGNCGQANQHYKQAISLSGYRNAFVGMARCYKSLGKNAEARQILQEGLQRYDDSMMKMMLEQLK